MDAFLCIDCGFCRFAKFRYRFRARPSAEMDRIESETDEAACLQRIENEASTARTAARKLEQLREGLAHALLAVAPVTPTVVVDVTASSAVGGSDSGRVRQLPKAILALEHLYRHEVQDAAETLATSNRALRIARQEVRTSSSAEQRGQPGCNAPDLL